MIQPSIERTATAPEEVCWSVVVVVEGLLEELLRAGGGGEEELSMSISLDAMFERIGLCVWASERGREGDDGEDFDAQRLERKIGGC